MKVIKKVFYTGLLTLLSVTVLISCKDLKNAFSSGVDFTNPEDTKTLNDLLNKHFTADMIVHQIKFDYSGSSSGFSHSKDGATIVYVDPENAKVLHGIEVNLKTGDYGPDTWMEKQLPYPSAQKGVKLENFDFSKIADIVNAARQAMTEENIESHGIGSFDIDFSSGNIDKYQYRFQLQHRTGSSQAGRTQRINYEEYSFKADKDGNLDFE